MKLEGFGSVKIYGTCTRDPTSIYGDRSITDDICPPRTRKEEILDREEGRRFIYAVVVLVVDR